MYEVKEKLLQLDIAEVIGKYTELKRAGVNYKGRCPLHNEKTPSFVVSPAKNIFKCFGCGKGGNIIDFIIEKEGLSFIDAVKKLAQDYHIEMPKHEYSDEDREKEKHRESLITANKLAAGFFQENLYKPENALQLKYVTERWSEETVKLFQIGFAPDSWDALITWSKQKGVKTQILLEAGLIKESQKAKGKLFDFFRNRIIFPIHDKFGRPIAFTGRDITGKDEVSKYMNTGETGLYVKGEQLFGLHLALKTIREKKMAYLVEGQPDVIRLQQIDINNVVAPGGTSLTTDQVSILKKYCDSINIIADADNAGKKSVERSAPMLIKGGLKVNIVSLPEGEDPDSFFTSKEQFKEHVNTNIQDYIIAKAREWKQKANNPDFKARAVNELCELIVCFEDPTIHELYADQIGGLIKPKKMWVDKIRALQKEKIPADKSESIPDHVKLTDFEKFGFYEDVNCYYFRTKSGVVRGSNFVMKPLFHVQSVQNAKRLYEIKNQYGYTETIELLQKDLVALSRFKERVESLGNFLWEASENELNKLKRYLYEKTETCVEITQLGWHKHGFFAWGNGIYNGEFKPVDEYGIVKYEEANYYLPALSKIYQHEEGLFMSERKFIHRKKGDISLFDYSKKIIEVFGNNANIAICFVIATIFRDHIVQLNNFYPLLNLFGPKGAGKTELAVSMLQFFGKQPKGPNINNTSKAALADHVAQVSNAVVHIDEYKNTIDFEKIEFLKGLWDGTGRTRMNMDKDKKKETTAVDSGIILSGQEMPTADIALFSRLVYLSFTKTEYNDAEKKLFNDLRQLENKGITHLTHEILSHREHFKKNYRESMEKVSADISKAMEKDNIEDRLFRNWVVIIAAYHTIREKIKLPFTYEDLISKAIVQMRIQQKETRKSNEVSTFWNIIQYLLADGLIQEGVDFKIDFMISRIKTDMVDMVMDEPKDIIYIQHSRIIPLYRKHGKIQGEKILPTDSIDYYLRNDKRYMGKKKVKFKVIDPKTGMEIMIGERKQTKTSWAYAFIYSDLGITMHSEDEENDLFHQEPKNEENEKETETLPF